MSRRPAQLDQPSGPNARDRVHHVGGEQRLGQVLKHAVWDVRRFNPATQQNRQRRTIT